MFKQYFKTKNIYSNLARNFSTNYDFDLAVIGGGPAGKLTTL